MPKSIKKDEATDNAVAVVEPVTTIVVNNEDVAGDIDRSDILIPSIQMVHKTSQLAELHTPGSWVLNQEELLSDGSTPFKLVVLKFRKYYEEDIPYGDERQARVADTIQQVTEMGGTTQWNNETNEPPSFNGTGEAIVLVEGKNEAVFPHEFEDGRRFAMARWIMRKSAFKKAGRKIITDAHLKLTDGLEWGLWELSSGKAQAGPNKYFVPVLTLKDRNSEEFAKWANELSR
ncbi:MAG: hypothetical protein CMC15_14015 [Flavobacteriaceae bacterium]|nr:hypothetical protein [Flavobacteriaceae bacterium]|tara:strand:+ start:1949 stop:2644 length:696 start_codon:yes stop_codon:yes gene_type:complete